MVEDYFTVAEIANLLGIPEDAVKDILADKWEWHKADVDRLLDALAKKLKTD